MSDSDPVPSDELQKSYDDESANIPFLSGKISELCKFIWAGSLAIFYATLTTASGDAAHAFYDKSRTYLLLGAIFGSLCLVFEYLQLISGYKHAVDFVDWVEKKVKAKETITKSSYNERTVSVFSFLNDKFFLAKNSCAVVSAALIAFAVIRFALS